MSDTPRTDATEYVSVQFARQLERELAAAKQEIERVQSLHTGLMRAADERNEALSVDLQNSRAIVKDICAEWYEDCDPCCDRFGHDENCRATNISVAKRTLNEKNAALSAELAQCRATHEITIGACKLLREHNIRMTTEVYELKESAKIMARALAQKDGT